MAHVGLVQCGEQRTIVTGGTVLVGDDLVAHADHALVIEGTRITRIAPASDIEASSSDDVVDARGLTLVPGFVDAHVHIGFHPPARVVAGGVTTVRDLGWPRDEIRSLVAESSRPGFTGPSILAVGPILTAPGGYPTRAAWAPPGTGLEVRGGDAAARAVDSLAEWGAVAIKIALNPPVGPVLDDETLGGIVETAHAHGLEVTAHVHGLDELRRALEAGVDELAHMLLGRDMIPDATIGAMVESRMAVVPTLSIRFGRDLARAVDNLARFRSAGGTVVYGTDLGNEGPVPGIDPREVSAMARAGMTPLSIIAAATTVARHRLRLDAGALAAGAPADVVALGGAPLEDARDLTDVRMVWRSGRRVR